MEQRCDQRLEELRKELEDQFAQNLKDLNKKFEVIQDKKVNDVQDSLGSKCESEKQTMAESLKSQFEVELNKKEQEVE